MSRRLEETKEDDGSSSSSDMDNNGSSKELHVKLELLEKENLKKDEEIETLNERVNYLRNLLVKMEKGSVDCLFRFQLSY